MEEIMAAAMISVVVTSSGRTWSWLIRLTIILFLHV